MRHSKDSEASRSFHENKQFLTQFSNYFTAGGYKEMSTIFGVTTLLELANVKLNCKYWISSIWPKLKQELVEKYKKLGPVLFHII
jgi:hypothetical protein